MTDSAQQIKKTLHFNMRLGAHQLIMEYYEQANDGRSFSSFVKDILKEQAEGYFNNDKEVLTSKPVRTRAIKREPEVLSTPTVVEDKSVDVDKALEDAVGSMFNP